jgi:DNA-binding GntR family transcriptional regulator
LDVFNFLLYTNTNTITGLGVMLPMSLPRIGNPMSLSDHAYVIIKDAIVNNQLLPRQVLSEEALANQLGISRTPLRAAMRRLAFERLISFSGKSAAVADISEEEIRKVFPVRIALEPVAAGIAAQVMTTGHLEELEVILGQQTAAMDVSDYSLYLRRDFEFHTLIAGCTRNEMLQSMVEQVNVHIHRFLALSSTLQRYSRAAVLEHQRVLAALKEQNAQLAEGAMHEHVFNATNRILD